MPFHSKFLIFRIFQINIDYTNTLLHTLNTILDKKVIFYSTYDGQDGPNVSVTTRLFNIRRLGKFDTF